MELPTWGVVPTKNRAVDVGALIASLGGQLDGLVVVDNNDEPAPPQTYLSPSFPVIVAHLPGYPPNLSALLNAGYDHAAAAVPDGTPWNVCYFNDDVVVPPGWAISLERVMRQNGAAAAYTDRLARTDPVLMHNPPMSQADSMTCWACMLRGELNVRWDEQFRWWYGDNDLDLRCRLEQGGVVAVPGSAPDHKHPSEQTFADGELSRLAHEDGARFHSKWNGRI